MYQRKVDVDMLNAVVCVLADVSSVSPSSEQRTFTMLTPFASISFGIGIDKRQIKLHEKDCQNR